MELTCNRPCHVGPPGRCPMTFPGLHVPPGCHACLHAPTKEGHAGQRGGPDSRGPHAGAAAAVPAVRAVLAAAAPGGGFGPRLALVAPCGVCSRPAVPAAQQTPGEALWASALSPQNPTTLPRNQGLRPILPQSPIKAGSVQAGCAAGPACLQPGQPGCPAVAPQQKRPTRLAAVSLGEPQPASLPAGPAPQPPPAPSRPRHQRPLSTRDQACSPVAPTPPPLVQAEPPSLRQTPWVPCVRPTLSQPRCAGRCRCRTCTCAGSAAWPTRPCTPGPTRGAPPLYTPTDAGGRDTGAAGPT